MRGWLDRLQPLGRALMLPIAVLPVAGLLLRLGQPDLLDMPFVAAAGDAIFSHLGLLFAIGVAVGIARENHGAAGLAGAVGYFVTVEGAKVLLDVPPDVIAGFADQASRDLAAAAYKTKQLGKLSIPAGILAGLVAGGLYNRFGNIRLPEYLAFFAGRRFVPIAAGLAGIFGALLFGWGFPYLEQAIDALSRWVVGAGSVGLFLYGALNRLLIVTGLHHILNNIAWFILGDYNGATGDLKRFFAGDPSAGAFMAGFFPVMMFGLPAACLAMYPTAAPERRRAVGGLLGSLALTSFLTGVTEPIEFAFMFLAPGLYALHALLTGLSMVVMDALGVRLGFGFSAGLFDYLLNFNLSTRPLWLLPVGALYFAIYYLAFRFCIVRFKLATPGRDAAPRAGPAPAESERGAAFVAALGGRGNLRSVDACTTRLRLVLDDPAAADEAALRSLGARGFVRAGANGLQVVLGPVADQVASDIRAAAGSLQAPSGGGLTASPPSELLTSAMIEALGGSGNIRSVEANETRLVATLVRHDAVDAERLAAAGSRGTMRSGDRLHVLVDRAGG
jgi:N-acetylglucosamine PTS system EIICBA or EIICB component